MKVSTRLGIYLFGLILGLCAMEITLRLLGESPNSVPAVYDPERFSYLEPFTKNERAGWQLKPGNYELLLAKRDRRSTISINPDASRKSSNDQAPNDGKRPRVIFIGDSFIFGEGLDDEESLPWQLQKLIPEIRVINHGVPGYGTCQARLRLEQIADAIEEGDSIIYGLSEFHEPRNTADPRLDYWTAIVSPSRQSGYPRCRMEGNRLRREDSKVWNVVMPFTGYSVVSRLFTDAWLALLAEGRAEQRALTQFLVEEMNQIAKSRRARLLVLLQELSPEALNHYRGMLGQSGIAHVDGSEVAARDDLKLPDGHPGPEMTKQWAEQVKAVFPVR